MRNSGLGILQLPAGFPIFGSETSSSRGSRQVSSSDSGSVQSKGVRLSNSQAVTADPLLHTRSHIILSLLREKGPIPLMISNRMRSRTHSNIERRKRSHRAVVPRVVRPLCTLMIRTASLQAVGKKPRRLSLRSLRTRVIFRYVTLNHR